jgi:hypothetical protein
MLLSNFVRSHSDDADICVFWADKDALAILSATFFGLVGIIIWVISKEIMRLSRKPCLSEYIPNSSMESQ